LVNEITNYLSDTTVLAECIKIQHDINLCVTLSSTFRCNKTINILHSTL